MKKGVKRIKPTVGIGDCRTPCQLAESGLQMLVVARNMFRAAGSSSTLARVEYAISSAKGAVRAASYRETRMQRERERAS